MPKENRTIKRVRGGGGGNGSSGGTMRGMGSKRKLMTQWSHSGTTMNQVNNYLQDNNYPPVSSISLPATPIEDTSNPASLIPSTSSSSLDQEMSLMPYSGGAEKVMQPPEEPPYFPEKYPGKVCALCCLGERSQLGQGEMLRLEVSEGESNGSSLNSSLDDKLSMSSQDDKSPKGGSLLGPQLSNRRQKGLNKCK